MLSNLMKVGGIEKSKKFRISLMSRSLLSTEDSKIVCM